MRRAIITTVGTAAAVAALLSYKSSNAVKASKVKVATGSTAVATTTVPASTTTVPSSASGPSSSTSPSSPTSPSATSASSTSTSSTSTATPGPRQFTGTDVQYNYGEIQLRVTTSAGKITSIDVAKQSAPDQRSESINSQAIPILLREAVAAQGVNIDVVSGATFTSQAFAQALQSALSQESK